MKEIVNRLQENRQLELAKSILESKGYKVTKRLKESEDHAGWEQYNSYYSTLPVTQYSKEYNDLYLTIYPPHAVPGDESTEGWLAEIQGINHNTHIDGYETGFNSFEEAEAWINSQIKNYNPEAKQSARSRRVSESRRSRVKRLKESVGMQVDKRFMLDDSINRKLSSMFKFNEVQRGMWGSINQSAEVSESDIPAIRDAFEGSSSWIIDDNGSNLFYAYRKPSKGAHRVSRSCRVTRGLLLIFDKVQN